MCSSPGFAQRPNLQLGTFLGINYSTINQKLEVIKPGAGAGFQGGFYFRITKRRYFAETGITFIRQVAFLSTNELDTLIAEENGVFLFQTEFPLIVGYKIIKTPLVKWRIYTGLSPTILGKVIDDNGTGYDRKQWTNPQVGWRLGTGIDIAFFTLDFKYSFGINKSLKRVFRTQSHLYMFDFGVIF